MIRVDEFPRLPIRPEHGHKGLFGRMLVVGGHPDMPGAATLAGTAALRMGAGLVQVAVPRETLPVVLGVTPELVGLSLGGAKTNRRLLDAAGLADVLVIGPGMGADEQAAERFDRLMRLDKPAVVDADALNLLSSRRRFPSKFALRAVLTPHPGEMRRLARLIHEDEVPESEEGRIELAVAVADTFEQVVVFKGTATIVTDGNRVFVNRTGDSSLSKAGAGDVLAGMIGTLLAQMDDAFAAAALAVHLHGLCGQSAGRRLGRRGVLARDVIAEIPTVVQEYDKRPVATK
jgi:NAD(P)H-hydrate epimerase